MVGEELQQEINEQNEKLKNPPAKKAEGGLLGDLLVLGAAAVGTLLVLETGSKIVKKALEQPSKRENSVGLHENIQFKQLDTLEEEIKKLEAEIEEAENNGDDMRANILNTKLQKKLQDQAARAQMLSNIISMDHETRMSIIRNIR
jgi:predicted mannosyl-3-phosphoglycerate phosphatase (HAD superfamily)